jgi:NAD(P)-dependent dehydrogenase (short-subunit alcohol dehydrogenase family)
MQRVVITGSNRGLGLEWVRQCAERGWRVFATCRDPDSAADLQDQADQDSSVSLHRLDVTDASQIGHLAEDLRDETIDLLVNNAGVCFERWGQDSVGRIRYDHWEETFRVNTLGPMPVTEALLPHLNRGERPLVLAITSHMGSIADIDAPRDYAYRSSKAALNAAMHGLAHELKPRGIGVLLLHPGWVRTRMGAHPHPLAPRRAFAACSPWRMATRRNFPGVSSVTTEPGCPGDRCGTLRKNPWP